MLSGIGPKVETNKELEVHTVMDILASRWIFGRSCRYIYNTEMYLGSNEPARYPLSKTIFESSLILDLLVKDINSRLFGEMSLDNLVQIIH